MRQWIVAALIASVILALVNVNYPFGLWLVSSSPATLPAAFDVNASAIRAQPILKARRLARRARMLNAQSAEAARRQAHLLAESEALNSAKPTWISCKVVRSKVRLGRRLQLADRGLLGACNGRAVKKVSKPVERQTASINTEIPRIIEPAPAPSKSWIDDVRDEVSSVDQKLSTDCPAVRVIVGAKKLLGSKPNFQESLYDSVICPAHGWIKS